jgi:hypothetical protein
VPSFVPFLYHPSHYDCKESPVDGEQTDRSDYRWGTLSVLVAGGQAINHKGHTSNPRHQVQQRAPLVETDA